MLVLRPADSAETIISWKMAMENNATPTALILSRQDVTDLPARPGSTRMADARGTLRGGYIVMDTQGTPDVVLVANGSEVSLLCEVAALLDAEGIKARVVSVPSLGLFLDQPEDYRLSVIPADARVFGLTAGLPSTLLPVVGCRGTVYGMERFGASAPYKVLDEKFGFTAPAVLERVKAMLG